MTEIKWQEPPVGRSKWRSVSDALRERPGEWALIKESTSSSLAANIKRGNLPTFAPAGSFEATTRVAEDGKSDIYARFVGENGEHR